ncbi:M23 family metallopeptidase [Gordonia paraffinivorans]|uniref:M23 family metallopeptidase n=1 Tax=Gordonia paraffinivorans TaxID=175628 RepID=UPI0014455EAB
MDDLAGPGVSGGSSRVRSGGLVDDVRSEEMTTIIPVVHADADLDDYDFDSAEQTTWTPSTWKGYYRPTHSEITQDILIPEHEFDQYRHDEPFDVEGADADVLEMLPEDEAGDADAEPLPFRTNPAGRRARRGGKHRVAAPPNALKGGRAALIAMAAGAAVAAVSQVSSSGDDAPATAPVNAAAVNDATAPADLGPGVAAAAPAGDQMDVFDQQLAVGAKMAADEARREALARRPLFVSPIPLGAYSFTSAFEMRWGSMHGGIDMAAPLGTPIHAVTDGVVIKAEPASGYGHWVQVRADDGTVTMYGHMSGSGVLVREGQKVTAGDVIALVGNEGFSFGPHLHFEVWKNGTTKIDPVPWLASKGVRMTGYTG